MSRKSGVTAGILLGMFCTAAVWGQSTDAWAQGAEEVTHVRINDELKYDYRATENSWVMARIQYPQIECEEAEGCEALKQTLNELSEEFESKAEAELDELEESGRQYLTSSEDTPYSYEQEVTLRRGDSNIVSFYVLTSGFTGGAHGYYYYTGYNIDAQTGEQLSLQTVLRDGALDRIPGLLQTQLLERNDVGRFMSSDIAGMIQNDIDYNGTLQYTLDAEGITFYFAPYDLTPYAGGAVIETLSYEEYPDLVKEEYQAAPENYITEVPMYQDVPVNAADGTIKDLRMEYVYFGDVDEQYFDITYGDKNASSDLYSTDTKTYLVHNNGKNYLYVQTERENEWKTLTVFDLDADEITGTEYAKDRWFQYEPQTDPAAFKLTTRMSLLSTNAWQRTYTVGEDGLPVELQNYDLIPYEYELTTLIDIEGEVRSTPNHENASRLTIPAGSVLKFYATDGESWVDFVTEDGSYVRFNVDPGWPQTVEGLDASTVFDGMRYYG